MEFLNPRIACERLIKALHAKGITDERVLDAFRRVPRHLFVDGAMYAQAYDDNALRSAAARPFRSPMSWRS